LSIRPTTDIADTDHGISNGADGISCPRGRVFLANNNYAVADRITLTFDQVSSRKDFVVDNVSITPLALFDNFGTNERKQRTTVTIIRYQHLSFSIF
jgi:hypothetical protein